MNYDFALKAGAVQEEWAVTYFVTLMCGALGI
jgi:hypothetical protein